MEAKRKSFSLCPPSPCGKEGSYLMTSPQKRAEIVLYPDRADCFRSGFWHESLIKTELELTLITTLGALIKRLLVLAVFVVLLVFFVDFTLSNKQPFSLDVLGFILPSVTASTMVIISFLVGAVLGLMASVLVVTRLKLSNASLKRKLKRRDSELHTLRTSALKGLTDA